MSNKTPAVNDGATESAPKHYTRPRSRTHRLLFWAARTLEVLLPITLWRSKARRSRLTTSQKWLKLLSLLIFVAAIGSVLILQLSLRKPSTPCVFKIPKPVKGAIPGRPVDCVQLEVAQTDSALILGLSGRQTMPRTAGMLFIFAATEEHCMWMKDMRFSLDILWLDENKRVVHIEKDVSPETFPKVFCSPQPAKYVVEVNAGIAEAAGIQIGQHLKL